MLPKQLKYGSRVESTASKSSCANMMSATYLPNGFVPFSVMRKRKINV